MMAGGRAVADAAVRRFGICDGVPIEAVTIRSKAGAEARILTFGAVIRDCVVPARSGPQRVCLGFDTMEDYLAHSPHFGAVPGRFANRIANGRFSLDGATYQLPLNEAGRTCLHGGFKGFGVLPWTLAAATADSVTLTLRSADGDQGFPGTLDVTCVYRWLEPATLRYEITATTDAPTVVNLTNHAYFNLDGSPTVLDHEVTVHGSRYTVLDDKLIPTGEIRSVEGTVYDFRQPRPVRNPENRAYDINFVIDAAGGGSLVHAARARSLVSGVTLDVHTDQPGVQLYDSGMLDCPASGLGGARYGRHAGLCLETQLFPDAPNQPSFPSSVLRPGERYGNTTEFRFS